MVDIITMVPIMPRFILNIREMHGREMHNRLQHIDTAFGLSTRPIASRGVGSTIVFGEGERSRSAPGDGGIQLEVVPGGC